MKTFFGIILLFCTLSAFSEDGYDLWLRYAPVENVNLQKTYRNQVKSIAFDAKTPTLEAAKSELKTGLSKMLGINPSFTENLKNDGSLMIGLPNACEAIKNNTDENELQRIGNEGFIIRQVEGGYLLITANTEIGLLYGVFRFLQILQQELPLSGLDVVDAPKTQVRILNHWDNLNRTVERGYAGFSLWDWFRLPEVIHPRYIDYARANASIEQYHPPVAERYGNIETCPEEYLLWFHRVPWDYRVKSGNTLWDEMAFRYN